MKVSRLLLQRFPRLTTFVSRRENQRLQQLLPFSTSAAAAATASTTSRSNKISLVHKRPKRRQFFYFFSTTPKYTRRSNTMDDAADDLAARFEEQASVEQQKQQQQAPPPPPSALKDKKNKGAGGGAGAGAGAAGAAQKREKDISRALSRLLRHQATNAGIQLDREGYAPLDKVLQYGPVRSLKATVADIIAVTADNEKQRFSMKPAADASSALAESDPSYWLIRANQGHSIAIESEALLTPITLEAGNVPPIVVHGTYFCFWERIVASGGLSRMGRNHVHCSTGLPEDAAGVVSGMRGDAELLVYVDVSKSLEDGVMSWWMSENGVVLTEGVGEEGLVPVKYFKEVVGRKEDVGVLWKDGKKVADLPEGVKGKVPPGKVGAKGRGGGGGGRGRGQGRGGRGGGRGRGDEAV